MEDWTTRALTGYAGLRVERAAVASVAELTAGFNRGFEGYLTPLWHTPESLLAMVRTNAVRLEASLLVRGAKGAPVGVALLGVRGGRGWVAGMGLAPEWRGRGVGKALLGLLLEEARRLGARRTQLEALEENRRARALYERMGFVAMRPLLVYTGALREVEVWEGRLAGTLGRYVVTRVGVEEALGAFGARRTAAPPWQREEESLRAMGERLLGVGLRDGADGALVATLLYLRLEGGFSLMDCGSRAVEAEARADEATALVVALTREARQSLVRAINVVEGEPLHAALRRLGCAVALRQWEMARDDG